MVLPPEILEDHGAGVRQALDRLWSPLYRRRILALDRLQSSPRRGKTPTVIAVVDARQLVNSQDGATDLAANMRAKINLLSEICECPIEVRVVLTNLGDVFEGYQELAAFCVESKIPLHVPPPPARALAAGRPEVRQHLDAWWESMRGYLPNALVSLEPRQYCKVVSFLSNAAKVSSPLAPFLEVLSRQEAVGSDLVYGGTYLASDVPGVANPLDLAREGGAALDPLRKHLVAAAVLAAACVGYLGLAFDAQHTRWSEAGKAFVDYKPGDVESDSTSRAAIRAFTSRSKGALEQHPDFFGDERLEMRKQFSDRIRKHFLIKRRNEAAMAGALGQGAVAMAARRSIFYLGVIHSDKHDRLKILAPGEPEIWASMLELSPIDTGLLVDYLENVDEPYRAKEEFTLPEGGVDVKDASKDWITLLDELGLALEDGVVTQRELRSLQEQTHELGPRLARFENDERMYRILRDIDLAASTEVHEDGMPQAGPLQSFYASKFQEFTRRVAWANDWELRRKLRRVVDTVDGTVIEASRPRTLGELVYALEQIYGPDAAAVVEDEQVLTIRIDGHERRFPSGKWAQILRDSRAQQYITGFLGGGVDQSSLFGPETTTSLPPLIWNSNGDAASFFVGRAVFDGRFTRLAYDKHLREMLVRLQNVLAAASVSRALKDRLESEVTTQINVYAARYRVQAERFVDSFDVQARSPEALRAALAQMVNDTSAFNDFLLMFDRNTRLDAGAPMPPSIRSEMSAFDGWHFVVDGGGGAPEIGKYRAILAQLLVDLSAPSPGVGVAAAPDEVPSSNGAAPTTPASTETLANILAPEGRLYLAELRGEKGSYAGLVEDWLTSVRMPELQRKPFRAPLQRLAELGRADLERAIQRVWLVQIKPSVEGVAGRFPFNRTSNDEVTPDELKDLFHPDGRLFSLFRRYIEPLADLTERSSFHPKRAVQKGLSLPPDLFPAINAAAALSARLWNSAGNPTPIEIATLGFRRTIRVDADNPDHPLALTREFLDIGGQSISDGNQKPGIFTVGFDWTKDVRSRVGVELTDTVTRRSDKVSLLVSTGTYWSYYHLLVRGQPSPVKSPSVAQIYTWKIQDSMSGDPTLVRFVARTDAWAPFASIGQFARRPKASLRMSKAESGKAPSNGPRPSAEAE